MTPERLDELQWQIEHERSTPNERELLDALVAHRQAMWDIDALLGFEHSDPSPDAVPDLIAVCVAHAREVKADTDNLVAELGMGAA